MNQRASTSIVALLLVMGGVSLLARAADHGHDHHHNTTPPESMTLAQRTHPVALPDVSLIRSDGQRVRFIQAVDDGRPVVLNFIYTSCTAICPVTSQVFMEFRELLEATERDKINMISVSIDPEQDTPRQLSKYAKRFSSAGAWPHYTGSLTDSEAIQRAFGAWRGDKMNHQPLTFIRSAPSQPWLRLEGFLSPTDLLVQYRQQALLAPAKK